MALRAFAKFERYVEVSKESASYLSDCIGDEDGFRRAARPLQWPDASKDTGISSSRGPVEPPSAKMPPPAPPSDTTAKGVEQGKGRCKSLGNPHLPSPAPRAAKTDLVQGTKEHWMDSIKAFCEQAGD